MNVNDIPVIAIDGPSASGKGTVAQRVAEKLGFHYLDSGALYRLVALSAIRSGLDLADERVLSDVAIGLDVVFEGAEIRLENENVADAIRMEACSNVASRIAAYPQVRKALLERAQRRYKQLMEKGIDANISTLLHDIQERDARDSNRSVAPLQQGVGTSLLDTTLLDIGQAVDSVLNQYIEICAKGRL